MKQSPIGVLVWAEQRPLDEKDVEVAVVVVVEQRNARPHHFRVEVSARHPIEMNEIDSRFLGAVAEDLFWRR